MTMQEAFDKMYLGLKTQGWKQSYDHRSCAFRGECGRKCAIGHLISDELAVKGNTILQLLTEQAEARELFKNIDPDFLFKAQDCHDLGAENMKESFENLAMEYELTIPS